MNGRKSTGPRTNICQYLNTGRRIEWLEESEDRCRYNLDHWSVWYQSPWSGRINERPCEYWMTVRSRRPTGFNVQIQFDRCFWHPPNNILLLWVNARSSWTTVVVIIEKVTAIIVNGLSKHNAPNSSTRFNYASAACDQHLSRAEPWPIPKLIISLRCPLN